MQFATRGGSRHPIHSLSAVASLAAFLAAWCLVGLLVLVKTAEGHDAIPTVSKPNGWSYPFSCCSGFDCREVSLGPSGIITERPEGYVVAKTGEVVPYTDTRVKESPDGETHWCSVAGKEDGRTICLFVPPRSF